MAVTPITGVCPTDCDTPLTFPAIAADQNCTYTPTPSQLCDLFIMPTGATNPFTDWGASATATADSIDNTLGDNTKSIHLIGIGSVEAPEKQTQELPKFKSIVSNRTYSVVFQITNLDDENYAFLRSLQCSPSNYTFWYGNEAHVFGIASGIIPNSTDVDFVYPTGRESVETATITIQYDAKIDVERINNPY